MSITNAQRDRLRTHPHLVKIYLSVLKPTSVVCDTIVGGPARGDRTISLSGVPVSGNLANAVIRQTVLVGTSCGDASVAKRRLRGFNAGANTIDVDENSVEWANGQFVTIITNYELWPRYPRILTVAPWTFYKDYGLTYAAEANPNEDINPVAIAGAHQVGFLDGGTITFDLDASDSYALASGAAITGYTWSCTGGAIANPNVAVTTITFNAAGTYWLTLQVTDGTKTATTRRVLFVHDRTGSNAPYTEFEFESHPQGDWERGGWETSIKVRGDATATDFPDGALVVVWYESWYAGIQEEIGGNTLFAGYVRRDSTTVDWNTGHVSFEATTIEALLRQHMMFSISLQAPTGEDGHVLPRSPETWYEFDRNNLTVATAIHHLWYWHSTLFGIADVFLPTSNTLLLYACDDFERGDLYSQADIFARQHGIFAHVVCNKQGQLHVEEDVNMLDVAGRGAVPLVWNGGLQETDRREDTEFVRRQEKETALVHLSGFSFDGATPTAIVSKAPGDAPEAIGGDTRGYERQVLEDQAQSNELAGRALAVDNDGFREIRIKFAGAYQGALDVVPQEWLELTLGAGDTPRGIVWVAQNMVCRNVQTEVDTERGALLTNGVFVREAGGPDGVTGDYPTEPPTPPDDDPPIDPPGWPPYTETGALVAFDEDEGCWYRAPGASDWVERDAGLPAGAVDDDNQGGWDPWWFTPEKQGTTDPAFAILFRCQDAHIYRSINCGVTWAEVTPTENPPNFYSDTPAPTMADVIFVQRADNIHNNGHHYFLARWQNVGGLYRGAILKTTDDCVSWTWYSLGRSSSPAAFAATKTDGLYRSDDFVYSPGDPTWEIQGQTPFTINMFAVDMETGLFQACINNTDEIWVRHHATYGDSDWHKVLDLVSAAALVAPGGMSWLMGAYINSELPGHMYTLGRGRIAGRNTLYLLKSTDYGVSWVARFISDTASYDFPFASLGVGRVGGGEPPGQVLYVFIYRAAPVSRNVNYSIDEGDTWASKDVLSGWPDTTAYITADPTDQSVSYVSQENAASDLARAEGITAGYLTIRTGAALRWDRAWISAIDSKYIRIVHVNTQLLYRSEDYGVNWTDIAISSWSACVWASDSIPSHIATGQNANGTVGVPHIIRSTDDNGVTWYWKGGANANIAGTGGGDSIPYDCGGLATHGLFIMEAESLYPIWMDVDTEDGTIIWITTWKSGRLYLERRQTSDLALLGLTQLGIATQTQLLSRELIAYPHTPLGDHDYVVVFGRMVDPGDVNSLQHIILTTDGAATFASIINDWAANICSAFLAGADDGGGNRIYTAIRDADAGAPADLYRGTNTVVYVSVVPFGNDRGVLVDALTMSQDGTGLACGADAAGAIMVVFTEDPFTTWADITDSYPVIGAVRSLTYL